MKPITKKTIMATAVAGLFMAGVLTVAPGNAVAAGGDYVKCQGVNSCKGQGACGAADGSHTCAGKNQCKGKGWVKVKTDKECTDKGGTVIKDKK